MSSLALTSSNNAEHHSSDVAKSELRYFSMDFDWGETLGKEGRVIEEKLIATCSDQKGRCAFSDSPVGPADSAIWGNFHGIHNKELKYYKDKRYLLQAFPEMAFKDGVGKTFLEVGAGTGAALWPIIQANLDSVFVGVDFEGPIQLLRRRRTTLPPTVQQNVHFFPCDATNGPLIPRTELGIISDGVDVALLIFCLSACPVESFEMILRKIFSLLKVGGILCFRDYGLYDSRHLKAMQNAAEQLGKKDDTHKYTGNAQGQTVIQIATRATKQVWRMGGSPRSYIRHDNTRAFFFSVEYINSLAQAVGFTVSRSRYACVKNINRKDKTVRYRCFVNAVFQKKGDLS